MYGILNTLNIGGYLELSTSNKYKFNETNVNDVLLYTDTPYQNILIGTANTHTGDVTVKINSNTFFVNKDFDLMGNMVIGGSNAITKFTMWGSNNSLVDGPNATYGFYNDLPVYQHLNLNHDDITTSYDNYWNGSNYIASSLSANYQIRKNDNKFMILANTNSYAGSIIDNTLTTALTVDSNSFIGIGNSNPSNRVTIGGKSQDISGPHIQAYVDNDGNNSIWQQLNWDKDNICTGYDLYYDGSNWISSQSNANFLLKKSDGRLSWYSSYNMGVGCNISSNLSISLSINSNNFIGVGTSNITNRLTISGPSNSLSGPHIGIYTDDDKTYPTYQQLNFHHDNILQIYDAYYNGSNIISSSGNTSFLLVKKNNKFSILSSDNHEAGSNIDNNLKIGLTVTSNSFVGIGCEHPKNRLTLGGPSNNIYGPHISAYTDDDCNLPVYQQLNLKHDDITTGYDCYWDGSNWISSYSTGGLYQLKKKNGKFLIQAACSESNGGLIPIWNNAFTINSNSYISIGNSNPTHRVTIVGESNSINGPHIAYYTYDDSNLPLFQQYIGEHDSIHQSYDRYFDGSNWISCHNNSSFRWSKSNDQLIVYASCNVPQGEVITFDIMSLVIGKNGGIGIGTSNCDYKLNIGGPKNSVSGPHTTYFTNDDFNYPLFQQTNIQHDQISTNYDMYWNGCNYISSSSNTNYQILKSNNIFSLRAAHNILPGLSLDQSLCNAISISGDGHVSIGGSNFKSRLNIVGSVNSIDGPHMSYYVDYDFNNPVMQHLNLDHNSIHTGYDTFYDGSDWRSSTSNSSFKLSKSSESLTYYYANSTVANQVIAWQPGISINKNGWIGIGTKNCRSALTIKGSISTYASNDDLLPTWCHYNYKHDNIHTSYDTFWDGSNWISSSSNGSFKITKKDSRLIIYGSSNNVVGTCNLFYETFTIHSNGFLGIGNINPSSRLTLGGPNVDKNGPHITAYVDNDSNYPLFQQLNCDHNNINTLYDQYWDGSNYISSCTNSSFQIFKSSNHYGISTSCNITQGCVINNSTLAYTVDSCGKIGVHTSNQTFDLEVDGEFMITDSKHSNYTNFDLMGVTIIQSNTVPPPLLRNQFLSNADGIYNIVGDCNLSYVYIIRSSSQSGSNGPNNIFNNDLLTTYWQSSANYSNNMYIGNNSTLVNGSNYYGEWVSITMPFNLQLSSYRLQSFYGDSRSNSIQNFYIVASKNGSNWDKIDYQYNQRSWTRIATSNTDSIIYNVNNNNFYSYYRIIIARNCGISTESPVINYMSFNGSIKSCKTRQRIMTHHNTLTFGSSNNNIEMSNGSLTIKNNLYQYGPSYFHDTVVVGSNVYPESNLLYTIGQSNLRWNNLYLSSNGIDINGLSLNRDSSGGLAVVSAVTNIPQRLIVNEILLGDQHNAYNSNLLLLTASNNCLSVNNASSNSTANSYTQFNNLYVGNINIGIGTNNPLESLDISSGDLLARNNSYVFSNFGLGTLYTTEKFDLRGGNAKLSSNLYISNKLGIGTSNPSESLVISNGNANIASNIYIGYNAGIGLSNPSESLEVLGNTKIDGSNFIQGSISIGTGFSNPAEKLDIIGNTKIAGNLYVMSNIGLGTSNPLAGLHVTNDIRTDSNIYCGKNLYVEGSTRLGDYIINTFVRSLSVNLLAYQNICVIGNTSNNTYFTEWILTQGELSNCIIKSYSFAVTGNQTNNNYERILPDYISGIISSNDFDLEIMTTSSNTTSFRLIRTNTSSTCSSNNIACSLRLARPSFSFLRVYDDNTSNQNGVNSGIFLGNMLTRNQKTGNVGIYTNNPQVTFEINGTDAVLIPSGNNSQRPINPATGHIRYNTTTSQFEGYGPANSWGSLGGVKSVDQLTYIAPEYFPGSGDDCLRFITSNVERMRIDSNGIVDIWSNLYVNANCQINGNFAISSIDFTDGLYTNQYLPSITLNMAGFAGSASNAGILIEEGSAITGYIMTTLDRNGYTLKPPNGTPFTVNSCNNIVNFQNNNLILYNNSVGINKLPNYSLDVLGTINANQILLNGISITNGAAYNGSGFWTNFYSNVITYCNVAIGLSNPSALFHLSGGNAILGCNLTVGSNLGISGNLSCTGSLSNIGNASLNITNIQSLFIQSQSSNLGTSYIGGNQIINGNVNFNNNLTINSNLIAIGSITNSNNMSNLGSLTINSNLYVGGIIGKGTLQQIGTANFSSNAYISGTIYSLGSIINSNYLSNLDNSSFSSNVVISSNLYVNQNIIANNLSNLGNSYFASNTVVNDITVLGNQKILGGYFIGSNVNFTLSSNLIVNRNIFCSNSFSNFGGASFSSNLIVNQSFCNYSTGYFSSNLSMTGLSNYGQSFFVGNAYFSNQIMGMGSVYFSSNVTIQNLIIINNLSLAGNFLTNSLSNLGDMVNIGNITTSTISNLSNMSVNGTIYNNNIINSCNITTYTLSNLSDQIIGGNTTSCNIISLNNIICSNTLLSSNIITNNLQSSGSTSVNNLLGNQLEITGNTSLQGNLSCQTFCNNDNAVFNGNVWVNGFLNNCGSIYITSNLIVAGINCNLSSLSISSNLIINGSLCNLSNTSLNNLTVNYSTSNLGNISISCNNIVWGSLGIGTSSPSAKLNITNPGSKKVQFDNDISSRRHIVLYETNNNEYQFCGFGMTSNTLCYQVDSNIRDHVFYCGSSLNNNQELLRITGKGSVGINTSSPSEILDIYGNIKVQSNIYVVTSIGINNSNPTAPLTIGTSNGWLQLLGSNSETRLISSNDSQSYLQHTGNLLINGTIQSNTHLFVGSNGSIGINNNQPQYLFDVNCKSRINNLIIWNTSSEFYLFNSALSNNYTSNWAFYQGVQGDTQINTAINQPLIFKNANTETLRIHTNNFIGINNSNPRYSLDVSGIISSRDGYVLPLTRRLLTGKLSELQNDAGFITQGVGSNGTYFYNTVNVISEGPAISINNQDPGDMLVTNYIGSNNRYGIGQYTNNALRLFASGNENATINLSVPINGQDGNATFIDYLTMNTQSGFIGINNTNPSYNLDVNGDLRVHGSLILGSSNHSTGQLSCFNIGSAFLESTFLYGHNSDFSINTLSNNYSSTNIYCSGINNFVGINTSNPLYGLDVHASGMTGIGTSNYIARFLTTSPGVGCEIILVPNNNISYYWKFGPDIHNIFNIYNQNNTGVFLKDGSTSWISNSDSNLKQNIKPIEQSLEKISKLNGYTYNWWHETNNCTKHYGLIAQEIKNIIPELVSENSDGTLGVAYTELIPILLEGIKELKKENEILKSESHYNKLEIENIKKHLKL